VALNNLLIALDRSLLGLLPHKCAAAALSPHGVFGEDVVGVSHGCRPAGSSDDASRSEASVDTLIGSILVTIVLLTYPVGEDVVAVDAL